MYRVPLLPSDYKPAKFEKKNRVRNKENIDSKRKLDTKKEKNNRMIG